MGKTNRGETTKLSIRLTATAKERIEKIAANLNLSKAGVILFVMANIINKFPDKSTVLNLEAKYHLEPNNFALTINTELFEKLNAIHNEYEMNKNVLFGLVISDYFESNIDDVLLREYNNSKNKDDLEAKTLFITINNELKKK